MNDRRATASRIRGVTNMTTQDEMRKMYPDVVELADALQAFFRERNCSYEDARQACINILVQIGIYEGLSPQEANRKLAKYFDETATYLDKGATMN
jgi:hypothetical protein